MILMSKTMNGRGLNSHALGVRHTHLMLPNQNSRIIITESHAFCCHAVNYLQEHEGIQRYGNDQQSDRKPITLLA